MAGKVKNSKKQEAIHDNVTKSKRGLNIRIYLPLIIFLLIYSSIWILPDVKLTDPWYSAVQKIDSARKVMDPAVKADLISEGGTELKALAGKFSKHARVQFFLGYYYFNIRNWDSAAYYFRRTIDLDSGAVMNPVAPEGQRFLLLSALNKSNDFVKDKDFKNALSSLENVKYLDGSPDLNNQYGIIYQNIGDVDSAAFYYEKTLRINPNNKLAQQNLTAIYLDFGNKAFSDNDFDKSLSFFKKAEQFNPTNKQVNYNLGLTLFRKGRLNEAVPYFKKVLEIDPNQKQALSNLVNIYQALGNQSESAKYKNLLDALPK